MELDELWGEIWGNVYPQFVHPQSTGGVDKIPAEKSQHRSPARESRGTAFLWSVQVKLGRRPQTAKSPLKSGVRPGFQKYLPIKKTALSGGFSYFIIKSRRMIGHSFPDASNTP